MVMTKMAPLTVALCVAVALQSMLAASVQKEDRVPKTSVGERSLLAWKRDDGFDEDEDKDHFRITWNTFLIILKIMEQWKKMKDKEHGRYLVIPRTGRDFVTGGEEQNERGGAAPDLTSLQGNPDRVCADVQRDGPLHKGLPIRLIHRHFQTADENGNGALEKIEFKKFLEKMEVLNFCMGRTV